MLLRLPPPLPPQLPLRGKCIEPPSPPIAIVFQAFLVAFVVVTREFRTIVRTARCLVVLFFETRRIAAALVISSAQHQDAAAISSLALVRLLLLLLLPVVASRNLSLRRSVARTAVNERPPSSKRRTTTKREGDPHYASDSWAAWTWRLLSNSFLPLIDG